MTIRIQLFIIFIFFIFISGCSSVSVKKLVPNIIKSSSQIKLDQASETLEDAKTAYQDELKNIDKMDTNITPEYTAITYEIVKNRRLILKIRESYLNFLVAEYCMREAELEMKAKRAGYFALGTKGVGISSGIVSAFLVAASSANAAPIAGLAALSSGAAAFQDTASQVGYSTVIAEAQLEALKAAVNKAYVNHKDVPWEYLYSYAEYAKQAEWTKAMTDLGNKIEEIETAIRYTKYEIKLTTTATPSTTATADNN